MRFEAMTRSATELTLEEFTRKTMSMNTIPDASYFRLKSTANGFMDRQEVMNDFSSQEGEAAEAHVLLSQNYENLTPKRSTLGPQSSICGAVSASSLDNQSDDEETDAAQSEQSLDPSHSKRLRRMLSNRESARRSRKRKQEHLTDLELMAKEMKGENGSLYNQLTNAHQQFRDADTSNRVLKSDVEALRAQVKLAEDMLAGGSFTCGLNQLVQSHLISPPQTIATQDHSLGRVANVSPTITIHGDDSFYSGDISNVNANLNNGIWR